LGVGLMLLIIVVLFLGVLKRDKRK
jgi:hypothetical protein